MSRKITSMEEYLRRQQATPLPQDADPYEVAFAVTEIRIEQLKSYGLIRRVQDITNEWEQDDHFDDLANQHRLVCGRLGLAWPPPPIDWREE